MPDKNSMFSNLIHPHNLETDSFTFLIHYSNGSQPQGRDLSNGPQDKSEWS